jgi:hypothetical protein
MLRTILKLRNWALLAGFVTIFASVVVCSFEFAISYPPFPTGQAQTSKESVGEPSRDERERFEKAANERGLTEGTWALVLATVLLFCAAAVQVFLFVWQLDLIRKSLADTKLAAKAAAEGAEAAKLNAEAVMAAEGAHLYPVIVSDDLYDVLRSVTWYTESGKSSDKMRAPKVVFRFKNYGKTPAVLESFMWGIDFYPSPSGYRTLHATDFNVLEVVGANEETADIEVEMLATFNRGMAENVRDYRGELLFFGEAEFKDFFNRRFRCVWECDGRPSWFSFGSLRGGPD